MESIRDILENNVEPLEKIYSSKKDNNESYIDQKTGLKYCSHCKSPMEKEIDFLGKRKKAPILCKCKQEKQKQQEEERQKINHLLKIDR